MVLSNENVTEGIMDTEAMNINERYKLLRRTAPLYRAASKEKKGQMLDMLCKQTGLHRKSLVRLLRQPDGPKRHPSKKRRSRTYTGGFDDAIRLIGRSFNWICSERMHGNLLERARKMEGQGTLVLSAGVREQLAHVSIATLRRCISRLRQDEPRLPSRRGRRAKVSELSREIPAGRIPANIAEPGHWELDLVYHGGSAPDGVYTVQMVDVLTGYSERRAIFGRSERAVCAAMSDIIDRCPVPILEIHSDNGTEFLNHQLHRLFGERLTGCRLTRSRPWHKNDNRFVEQKNYTLVRAYLPRSVVLTRPEQAEQLNALYDDMGIYYNLLEPVMRMTLCYVTYTPDGHVRIRRQYDRARTPLVRLLETGTLSAEQETCLKRLYDDADPVALFESIRRRLDALIASSCRHPSSRSAR